MDLGKNENLLHSRLGVCGIKASQVILSWTSECQSLFMSSYGVLLHDEIITAG